MDVLLLMPYMPYPLSSGPIGVACNTIEGFVKINHRMEKEDIKIHVLSSEGRSLQSITDNNKKNCSSLSIDYFSSVKPISLTSDLMYFRHLLHKRHVIDIVHSHNIYGAFCSTSLKIPTIMTLHGILWKEREFAPNYYSKLVYDMETVRFKYSLRKLNKIVAISPYVVEELRRISKHPFIEEIIENPISDAFFDVSKHEEENFILAPGVISQRKNQFALLKVANALKSDGISFKLVFTGGVKDYDYFKSLKHYVSNNNLGTNVYFKGEVTFPELLNYYSKASLLTLISKQETAPMVISEAMATGTPVVTSNIAGIPYMVRDEEHGFLVDPDNVQQIAKKICTLLDDKSLRRCMGDKARVLAKKRWKNEIIANKLLDLYLSFNCPRS